MIIKPLSIPDVKEVEINLITDSRGSFGRLFCPSNYSDLVGKFEIKQINSSCTLKQGALRGMHFQHPPFAETKIITCIMGKVFDVAVDLRVGSDTFLKWTSTILSCEKKNQMVIPPGFAHGFQVLEGPAQLIYLHDQFYKPEAEAGLRYNDPRIAISWPLPVTNISERDKVHELIDHNFKGI
jgi:dTDP-4-dehydrorhamnose 3,5-epimerase